VGGHTERGKVEKTVKCETSECRDRRVGEKLVVEQEGSERVDESRKLDDAKRLWPSQERGAATICSELQGRGFSAGPVVTSALPAGAVDGPCTSGPE
jgi:hypothetical protein